MKTKIRFLINSLTGGGAEKVLVDLLKCLDPERYDLTVLTITGGVHKERLPGYVHYRQIVKSSYPKVERLLAKICFKLPRWLFATLFLPGQYDIEIAYLEGSPVRFMAAKRTKGAKIAFVHCDLSVKNTIAPLYRSEADCLDEFQSFTKVCFVSDQGMKGFEKTVGPLNNGCVVHNVIDLDQIRALSEQAPAARFPEKKWKLVAVGRFVREKAFDRLLRIVSVLEKAYDIQLWILGDGQDRPTLEQMIEQMQIRGVRLMGYQLNPCAIVRQADLFVCSSVSEGYSTAVTEALALGVPVITTRCAGMDEILENGKYGVIVENSEEALLCGLKEMFDAPEEYKRLKTLVVEKSRDMTNDRAVGEYTALFDSVLSGR